MSGYERFQKRMRVRPFQEELRENAKHYLDETFEDDPSYLREGAQIWRSDRVLHPRIDQYTWRSTTPYQAEIATKIEEPIYIGDIIKWNDDMGYWLIVGAQNLHGIQWKGTLQFCNFRIKFLSPLDGTLLEYPVSMLNATQYGIGEHREKLITVGSSSQVIYLTADEHTVLLDNGRRFLMDKNKKIQTAFEITSVDTTSYGAGGGEHGYLRLYVVEDLLNPKTDDGSADLADAWLDPVGSGEEVKENKDLWL